jgi:hypothetical protein
VELMLVGVARTSSEIAEETGAEDAVA